MITIICKNNHNNILMQLRNVQLLLFVILIMFSSSSCSSNITPPNHETNIPIQTTIFTQLPTINIEQPTNPLIKLPTTAVTLTLPTTTVPNNWKYTGPDGDEIIDLEIDPISTSTLYTTTKNGTYKSTDGGLIWINIDLVDACEIEIDPATSSTIYATTRNGFYKSIDSGEEWKIIADMATSCYSINSFALDANNPLTIYIASGSEVMKSTDGGQNWITHEINTKQGITIAIDPFTPRTLYVGTRDGLIIKSTDDGENWSEIKKFKYSNYYIEDIKIDPITPSTIYVSVMNYGVIKSTNGGETWRDINQGLSDSHISSITINPNNPYILYAGSIYAGIFRSSNGGSTWYKLNTYGITNSINCMVIDPINNSTLYAGTYFGGIVKSTDSGEEWISVNAGITNKLNVLSLAIDPTKPTTLYAGVENRGLLKSKDGGNTWFDLNGGRYISFVIIDPTSPSILYIENWWIMKSTNGGGNWSLIGIHRDDLKAIDISSFAIDPVNPNNLYAGVRKYIEYGGVVFKSSNRGESWKPYNNGLPKSVSINVLAIDPTEPRTIYAGTDIGLYKSKDGGENWVESGISGTRINSLAINPFTPSNIIAGTAKKGVFKSSDAGNTWFSINGELPEGISIRKLVFDPIRDDIIYICTYKSSETYTSGVYKSTNGGVNWVYLGLSDISINDLVVYSDSTTIIYAATETGIYYLE